jgi:uncharacterized protein (TIGR02646 family)
VIYVQRTPEPEILRLRASRWLDELRLAPVGAARRKAQGRYAHRQVRKALETCFAGKCAYCESQILHVGFAHIEHFRPKSRFPELTFVWENLLLACGRCNSTENKGDAFPVATEGGPLIDPCREEPGEHLQFHYDPRARLASVYGATHRGRTTEQLLGLNRHDLRSERSRQIARLAALRCFAEVHAEARALFNEACSASAPYAAFARALDRAFRRGELRVIQTTE